jgi:hypothetical protein
MIEVTLVNLERRKPDGFAGVTSFSPGRVFAPRAITIARRIGCPMIF